GEGEKKGLGFLELVGAQADSRQCQAAQPIFRISGEEPLDIGPNRVVDPKILETVHPEKDLIVVQGLEFSQGPVLGIQVGAARLQGVENNELSASRGELRIQPECLEEQGFHGAGSAAALLDLAGD